MHSSHCLLFQDLELCSLVCDLVGTCGPVARFVAFIYQMYLFFVPINLLGYLADLQEFTNALNRRRRIY